MMNLPSAESLMLQAPNEVLEDLLARKVYEASIKGQKEVILEGNTWKNEKLLMKIKEKGFHVEKFKGFFQKPFLKVYWD